jgi:hypothetical protein
VVIWTATPLFQPFLFSEGLLVKKRYSASFQFHIPHKGITGYFLLKFHISRFQNSRASILAARKQKQVGLQAAPQAHLLFSKIEVFQCSGIGVSCLVRVEECGKTGFRDSAQCTVTSTNTTTGGL